MEGIHNQIAMANPPYAQALSQVNTNIQLLYQIMPQPASTDVQQQFTAFESGIQDLGASTNPLDYQNQLDLFDDAVSGLGNAIAQQLGGITYPPST